ncbi:ClpP/crotonase [Lentithecium fluviatile CBS 122367]|uniref:ClpP/crotonase n=1 Tax=Lentithecium fluviatile CBS 122367 TaxID=1168545 RepID=A0A6G1ILH1_9PLEO|nr:ClpP/crotonase [Lentithecium fluviatile CBS 122367]
MAPAPPPQCDGILVERLSESAVLLSYNRLQFANAFTPRQFDELRMALVWARKEDGVKVVVVMGNGKHFCAGRAMDSPASSIRAEAAAGKKLGEEMMHYPKLLIAAVHGASIGWGCTQLPFFDLVYAHQDAFFQTPFVSLGLVPEAGSSYTLPKLMGRLRANALLLAGDRLSAQDAYVGGLVSGVVDAPTVEAFRDKVLEKVRGMRGLSAEALRLAKRLVGEAVDAGDGWMKAWEGEERDLLTRAETPEARAILEAFGNRKGMAKL